MTLPKSSYTKKLYQFFSLVWEGTRNHGSWFNGIRDSLNRIGLETVWKDPQFITNITNLNGKDITVSDCEIRGV